MKTLRQAATTCGELGDQQVVFWGGFFLQQSGWERGRGREEEFMCILSFGGTKMTQTYDVYDIQRGRNGDRKYIPLSVILYLWTR